jgi:cytidylate kinase
LPPRTIALDGPAAAGKTTVGRRLADALGYLFLDTGALYRALTVVAVDEGIDVADGEALAAAALEAGIEVRPVDRPTGAPEAGGRRGAGGAGGEGRAGGGGGAVAGGSAEAIGAAEAGGASGAGRSGGVPPRYAVYARGRDVTARLNDPLVDRSVAAVSRHAAVRSTLIDAQRRVANLGPVVMVGRDIGTVVMPDADLKVYLDASASERARRRLRERLAHGEGALYPDILSGITLRDRSDAQRDIAPLAQAQDAVVVGTDDCTIDQVVATLADLVSRWPETMAEGGRRVPCASTVGSEVA